MPEQVEKAAALEIEAHDFPVNPFELKLLGSF